MALSAYAMYRFNHCVNGRVALLSNCGTQAAPDFPTCFPLTHETFFMADISLRCGLWFSALSEDQRSPGRSHTQCLVLGAQNRFLSDMTWRICCVPPGGRAARVKDCHGMFLQQRHSSLSGARYP